MQTFENCRWIPPSLAERGNSGIKVSEAPDTAHDREKELIRPFQEKCQGCVGACFVIEQSTTIRKGKKKNGFLNIQL